MPRPSNINGLILQTAVVVHQRRKGFSPDLQTYWLRAKRPCWINTLRLISPTVDASINYHVSRHDDAHRGQDVSNLLKRIANEPVPPDLLKAALSAIGELPKEDRKDMTEHAITVIRVLDKHGTDRGIEGEADLLTGILFRLEALARLHDEPAFRAWSMKSGTPDMDYIHEDLVEAAAVEPLVMGKHQARFDANSFFKRVLQISEARGQA